MRTIFAWVSMLLAGGCLAGEGDSLLLVSTPPPQRVFGGGERVITATFENLGETAVQAGMNLQLVQTSYATAVLLSETPWKTLKVLPGQTVLESVRLDFPEVRAETPFAIRWLESTNRVVGVSQVQAYPTNLLQELSALVGEDGRLGLFDPADQLKPILRSLRVEFEDLENSGVAGFRGQLAILGPFESKSDMPGDLVRRVQEMASKGVPTVWMQPPPGPRDKLQPSFVTVPVDEGTVVLMQHNLIPDLAANPQSQLNLIHCCRLAVRPEPARLPQMRE